MAKRPSFLVSVAAASGIAAAVLVANARPAAALPQIRDAEIEHTIAAYAAPLLRAASLDPEAVHFHILKDKALNAFVAGGQNVFVTTGLLRRAETPGQVMGVFAHELGHVAGGHLARSEGAMRNASNEALLGMLLGAAVGLLARNPQAAAAVTAGAANIAQTSLMRYSQGQESAADQAGLRYLDRAGISARGLLDFLGILEDQELLVADRQEAYARTHPITRDRIELVRNFVAHSSNSDNPLPPEFVEMHARMVAKLDGFLDPPQTTLRKYKADDRSIPSRYARAIAYYRIPDLDKALPLIDGLIAERPKDPYFHELKGQILFENGRLEEARSAYEEAVRLLPGNALLRTALAHVEIELGRPELDRAALGHLKAALRADQDYPMAWRLAGIAYGRTGQEGEAALALAEYNLAIGRHRDSRHMAERALRALAKGSPGWLRADDIRRASEEKLTEDRDEPRR